MRKAIQISADDENQKTKPLIAKKTKDKVVMLKDKSSSRVPKTKHKTSVTKDATDTKNQCKKRKGGKVENTGHVDTLALPVRDTENNASQPGEVDKAQNVSEQKKVGDLSPEKNQRQATTTVEESQTTSKTTVTTTMAKATVTVTETATASTMETATTMATVTTANNLTVERKQVKKYAQLKTLKTSISKCDVEKRQNLGSNIISMDTAQCSELTQHILQIPDLIDRAGDAKKI